MYNDDDVEAAWLSKQAGVPVNITWSREDDMTHDSYRPSGTIALKAGLDAKGSVIAWRQHFVTFGDGKQSILQVPASIRASFPAGYVARIPAWNVEFHSSCIFVPVRCAHQAPTARLSYINPSSMNWRMPRDVIHLIFRSRCFHASLLPALWSTPKILRQP